MSLNVAIVGGGVAGCASAYYLARSGHNVTLFERDSVASHASGFALGGIIPPVRNGVVDEFERFSLHSIDLHRQLNDTINPSDETNFYRKPSMALALDEFEAQQLIAAYKSYSEHGSSDIRWLSYGEFSHIDARVSPSVIGGLYFGESYEVDPYKLTLSLWQAAEQNGATLVNREVTSINETGGKISGVSTEAGTHAADAVIAAAGPWSTQLLESVGVHVPVIPLKGQILRLQAPSPALPISLWWGENYASTKEDGLTWIGTTEEEVGFDDRTTDEARDSIIGSAVEVLPYLENADLVQQTACLRPITPDRAPIVDARVGPEGLVVSTGGGRNGILLGPAMGEAAADLVVGTEPQENIDSFSLARFS